jgi:hypothetical protein
MFELLPDIDKDCFTILQPDLFCCMGIKMNRGDRGLLKSTQKNAAPTTTFFADHSPPPSSAPKTTKLPYGCDQSREVNEKIASQLLPESYVMHRNLRCDQTIDWMYIFSSNKVRNACLSEMFNIPA